MGKPQEKKSKKGRDSSEKNSTEKNLRRTGIKALLSLKGALIYRKKKPYSGMGQHARRAEEKV